MTCLTPDDCRRVRDQLDALVRAGALSWKKAANAWSVLVTACKAACGKWIKDQDGRATGIPKTTLLYRLKLGLSNPPKKSARPVRFERTTTGFEGRRPRARSSGVRGNRTVGLAAESRPIPL